MKKLALIAGMITIFVYSCQKEITQKEKTIQTANQTKPVCGTDEAMKMMDPALKAELMSRSNHTDFLAPHIVIYLDFDGAVVTPGYPGPYRSPLVSGTRFCPPAPMTAEQKQEVVDLVDDYFSPFNITVTTDEFLFSSTQSHLRQLCIVTTISQVIGWFGVAGVAVPTCNRLHDTPCFAFAQGLADDPKFLSGVIAHELGHMFGLDHQSLFDENCQVISEYHPIIGSGPLAFSPIMGSVTNTGINSWFVETCYANECRPTGQEDFSVISSQVVLREDDFPNIPSGNNELTVGPVNGILDRQNDVDYILINFRDPGSVNIRASNIDIKASLVTLGGHVLSTHNDPLSTNVTIPVAQGMIYLKIEGASNSNMSSQFMTGKYKVEF